jgi:hypothetical protein
MDEEELVSSLDARINEKVQSRGKQRRASLDVDANKRAVRMFHQQRTEWQLTVATNRVKTVDKRADGFFCPPRHAILIVRGNFGRNSHWLCLTAHAPKLRSTDIVSHSEQ